MEAEIKEMDVKQGNKAYSEDANVDEAIPIQIIKERTTEAYKEKRTKISKPLTNMRIEHQFRELNGDQYMRLQMKIISKIVIYFLMILS